MTSRLLYKFTICFIAILFALTGCAAKFHLPEYPETNNTLRVYFLDIGQGDSTLLLLPDNTVILVDTGSPAGAPLLVDHLRQLNVDTIHHLILTHPHDDHIGGVFNTLHEFKVHSVYDNGHDNHQSTLFHDYVKTVRKSYPDYQVLRASDTMDFGDVKISVLNPIMPLTQEINEDSIVIRVNHGKVNMLLTGDIRRKSENRIMASGTDLMSNIFKVGHHGDSAASTYDFLQKIKPEVAVISVGRDNKFAKPHPEALGRIKAAGARIFRTDVHGTVLVESDGNRYLIKTDRNQTEH